MFKAYRLVFLQRSASESKTGTSKVGAISEAQEAQKNFFSKKFLNFFLSENVT